VSRDVPDVAVVGGGIVGAACAYWATRAGLEVVAVERAGIGAGSTGAGTGHIVVLDHLPELLALTAYSRRLWHEVAPSLPAAVGWRVPGTIWLANDRATAATFDDRRRRLDGAGVRSVELDPAHLGRLEPVLAAGLAGGLWVRDDAQLDPVAAAHALWDLAGAAGARLEVGVGVRRLSDGGVELDDGRSLRARHVIVAAGGGTPPLAPDAPVTLRKGHVLRLAPGAPPVAHVLVEAGYNDSTERPTPFALAFNAQPQPDGTVLLGSTRQSADAGSGVDPTVVERLRERARPFAPSLADRTVTESRVGFRPAADGPLPWIGPLPGPGSRWVAAGHEGFGVTAAMGTGRLLVDLIIGERPALPMEPYRPGRRPPTAGDGA